jgi:hypothetical protein
MHKCNCNPKGKLSYNCPNRALFSNPTLLITNRQQERVCHRGTIDGEGDYCRYKTVVCVDFVTPDNIIDGEVTIQCAHGSVVSYPLAAVKM